MTYDEIIKTIEDLNKEQNMNLKALPHCSNLLFQLKKKTVGKENYFKDIAQMYLKIREISLDGENLELYVEKITAATNHYMDLFWPQSINPFSHQSDFGSSIVPEMLCCIFGNIIKMKEVQLEVSAQKDLTIECVFDFTDGGDVKFKNKRMDVVVVKNCILKLDDKENVFPIPLMAIECKTNLDKNMLSGIEFSVSELKKTFPRCYYLVVSELSDFDVKKSNYASSGIDEMYILRKQKRAETRREPYPRNEIFENLVYEIAKILLNSIDEIMSAVEILSVKMQNGKLIGR